MCSVCTLVPVTRYSLIRMIMMHKLLLNYTCMYTCIICIHEGISICPFVVSCAGISQQFSNNSTCTCAAQVDCTDSNLLFYVCSLARLKTQIEIQTGLEPGYQELFFKNLPYRPQRQIHASKLPTISVS